MTNRQDPAIITSNFKSLATVNLMTVAIMMWEWIINLNFEWKLLTRKTDLSWPRLVCATSRMFSLATAITTTIVMTATIQIDCNLAVRWILVLGYLSVATASLLIALRAIAIWYRNKYVIAAVAVTYLADIGWMIYGIVPGIVMDWDPIARACITFNTSTRRPANIGVFACDVCLLIVMLTGLWRHRGSGSLATLIKRQGVVWFMIALAFYVPEVLFVILDFNDPMNLMLQIPVVAAMNICGIRMQLYLYDQASSTSDIHLSPESELQCSPTIRRNVIPLMSMGRLTQSHILDRPDVFDISNKPTLDGESSREEV